MSPLSRPKMTESCPAAPVGPTGKSQEIELKCDHHWTLAHLHGARVSTIFGDGWAIDAWEVGAVV